MKHSFFFLFMVLFFVRARGQVNWRLEKQQNGIEIYTGHSDSSNLKSIRVHTVLEGTPQKLVEILRAVEKNKDWVYATKRTYLIKKISDNELLYYAETALPWPMSNRDQAIRMTIVQNPVTHALTVITTGEPGAIPKKNGLIRIPYFFAKWEVGVKDSKHLDIYYYLRVNPGGTLSPFIVNLFVTKGPYESFYSLSKLLKK